MTYQPTFPPGARLAAFERMVAAFERDEIEAAVDALIARLDAADGDPDLEDEDDRCAAGEDHIIAGPVAQRDYWERYDRFTGARPGGDDDFERPAQPPVWSTRTLDVAATA